MAKSSLHRVLWVDDDPNVLAAGEQMAQGQDWTVTGCRSIDEARQALVSQRFGVVICDQQFSIGRGTDFLNEVLQKSPAVSRILLPGTIDLNTVREAVNKCRIFRLVTKPWDEVQLKKDISEAILRHAQLVDQKTLLKEINKQNRELEDLTFGLEQTVRERTRRIEQSKNEAEQNLATLRQLVRFVKNLSEITSMEEFFLLLRKEFLHKEGVSEPILSYIGVDQKERLFYFRNGRVLEREVEHGILPLDSPDANLLAYRQFFANELGRPLGKMVVFSLDVPCHFRSQQSVNTKAYLFVEHALPKIKVDELTKTVERLLQPLSIAFDRMLVEKQMQHASYQWASTFDAIQDPVAIVDVDYQVIRANRHFLHSEKKKICYQAGFNRDQVCEQCPVGQATATGKSQDAFIKFKDRVFAVSSYPIVFDPELKATSVVNHYVDVTASRDLYVRMIQNEKMAAIGLLASSVAHELNNPLTGIRNLAQVILKEASGSGGILSDLEEVEKAAARCQQVIRDLIDFSEGGSDGYRVIRIGDMVRKTLTLLKTALHNFELHLDLTEERDFVYVEPHLLQQVIFNLLNNACQAMGEGGELYVTSHVLNESSGSKVCLRVRDTGPGIPPEKVDKIFEPFYTTKAAGEGTGLGLSISRAIVDSFGGRLTVAIRGGVGAEFVLLLNQVEEEKSAGFDCR